MKKEIIDKVRIGYTKEIDINTGQKLLQGPYLNTGDRTTDISEIDNKTMAELIRKQKDKDNQTSTGKTKITNMLDIGEEEWAEANKKIRTTTNEIRHRSFIYRYQNRLIYTNKDYHRFGHIESTKCTFCEQENQDYDHLFFQCRKVKELKEKVADNIAKKGSQTNNG